MKVKQAFCLSPDKLLEHLYRQQTGQMLAWLTGLLRDLSVAEEIWHDSLALALKSWPKDLPDNPGGWLRVTARHLAIDRLRHQQVSLAKSRLIQALAIQDDQSEAFDAHPFNDELLKLIFTCCHPAIAYENRLALTLYAVCGLTTRQIANALLLSTSSLEQRLTRAKSKLKSAGIGFVIPQQKQLPERLDAVLKVIYLLFTSGYQQEWHEAQDEVDLAAEALRLGNLVLEMLPEQTECMGLVSLMEFNLARRNARADKQGNPVLLQEQDRSLWDRNLIEQADARLEQALRMKKPGSYQLQAAIAGVHCLAQSAEQTDWLQINALYSLLMQYDGNPVIAINAAVALAMLAGEEKGLAKLNALQKHDEIAHYALLYSAKAELYRRAGDPEQARIEYEKALARTENSREQSFYLQRLAGLIGKLL
ncbi:RNA polymerase sigma factor [Bowmanella dokdonensis]|uniref:RNA polymerase subunit sigma-24 n=1 Tax=Bowmanella dokdonensis TaxID=751969 RepID=A0A939ITA4_9ALTE|nr:DUF6596 domain-containing protein [Bowmanella dokdonensis]MBN7827582.1 RNA polymerase subunit sigma-24 [Bowmanella dokdonensis]